METSTGTEMCRKSTIHNFQFTIYYLSNIQKILTNHAYVSKSQTCIDIIAITAFVIHNKKSVNSLTDQMKRQQLRLQTN